MRITMLTYNDEITIFKSQYLKFCEAHKLNERESDSANVFLSHTGLDGIYHDQDAFINDLLESL